jgi:two-component system chemotaxis response regulator CheB
MAKTSSKQALWVVVIGTSAGGLAALQELLRPIPKDFPAAIFVVQHLAPTSTGEILADALKRIAALPCRLADDQDQVIGGRILVARPDLHLLVKKGKVLVTKGARENRYRPGIDPLFRSAAVAYGNRVIGIVLTGRLDDGTAGLASIKACGGTCIVQSPEEAAYSDMPASALENVKVDYSVPIAEMSGLLQAIISQPPGKRFKTPPEIVLEAEIAERVLSDVDRIQKLGKQVPYNCPACGGVLWQMTKSKVDRYRCHTGHSFTSAALEAIQLEKIEETLWISLRMFEERRNLLNTTAGREDKLGYSTNAGLQRQRAKEAGVHIERIRDMLRTSTTAMTAGIPPKH